MTRRITVLGTGLMGAPIARTLARAGLVVTAYNRTTTRSEALRPDGVLPAGSADEAIEASPVLLTMLTDADAVRSLLLEPATRRLGGRTVIQMSTIGPDESTALERQVHERGGRYLEAPVLGSIPEAEAGTLIVMAAGPKELFDDCHDVLDAVGEMVLHVGQVGAGSALKLAMNQLIGSLTAAFAVSLGLVRRSGVDIDVFMDVVRHSALYAKTFDKKLDRMLARDYSNPNFPTKHLLKDMLLVDQAARTAHVDPALVSGTIEALRKAVRTPDLADGDYSALYDVIDGP